MIPVVLSIFGVILFLRLGVLVGQAGFFGIWGIFTFGYLITTLTIISISAIVTNGKVKGGGVYYVISRSLGPELGGSIGIIYAVSNVFAGGLYVVGFIETLIDLFPETWPIWTKSHGFVFIQLKKE
jgi:solute carrier family 12 (potassium/chloride transporters), member 9